jgi:hypothetical protein
MHGLIPTYKSPSLVCEGNVVYGKFSLPSEQGGSQVWACIVEMFPPHVALKYVHHKA